LLADDDPGWRPEALYQRPQGFKPPAKIWPKPV